MHLPISTLRVKGASFKTGLARHVLDASGNRDPHLKLLPAALLRSQFFYQHLSKSPFEVNSNDHLQQTCKILEALNYHEVGTKIFSLPLAINRRTLEYPFFKPSAR